MASSLRSLLSLVLVTLCTHADEVAKDVVVYGATPGGITAAISASREGHSVVLLEQTRHVGGLSTSGLNRDEAEHMDTRTFGGLSEKFLLAAHLRSRGWTELRHPDKRHPRTWQSKVAEKVFLEMLEEAGVEVRFEQLIQSVEKQEASIVSLTVRGGTTYKAKVFIDATYEGDLMAKAGVSYALGRESRDQYRESLGGVRYLDDPIPVSPYDKDGKLLPGIMPGKPPAEFGASPHPICYNIRLNLTTDPENKVEIEKPENYDPKQYELLIGSFQAGKLGKVGDVLALYGMPGDKRECNNKQAAIVSLSMPGEQTAWAEASFEQREAIHQKYRDYTHGLLWFMKTDPRMPEKVRKEMASYGFCKDEWTDNDHWPWYLYIRAARRMIGPVVLTQHDVTETRDKKDVIHIGSHYIDSHHVARYAYDENSFINEGRIWQKGMNFDIPYRAITPKQEECDNLLVPVCVSASAVAFYAIRLEPTWMHLGEASGMAASLAIKNQQAVQTIDVPTLQGMIQKQEIPLDVPTDEDVQEMVKQFKTRLKTSIIEENQIIYDASESVKTMQPDGSWPGIDYGSKAMHNWPGNEHLFRMVDMSVAYVADPKHPLYKNDDLLEKILRSIDFWFARNPTEGHPNWWYRSMQPQMSLSKVCLLMDPYLGKERRAKMVGILQSDVHSRHTGANLVWFAENTFFKGIFLEDYAMMQHAVAALNRAYTPAYKTLHEVALEGLQPDSSFTQHGMHFYNNMYGLGYFMSSCRWLYFLHDSPLAFSNATRNLINDMALNGNRWMLRYHQNDPSSRGRAIATRVPERGSASPLLHPLELLKKANDDPETKSQIQHFIDHINGKRPTPGVVGNRYFWRVDYMSHIREKFFASVRMVSKGVKGSEETIGNNVLGGLTSYGLTFIMRTGREYDHIFPVWDWALLPGVSAPRETFRPNHLSHIDSTFVGGVTDGTYGCAAMDFAKKIPKINKSFSGKKAYFFFDDEIVALGTALSSDSNNEFNTTLNQCLLTDQVYIDGQPKGLEASPVAKQYEGRWVNHDSIGYVFPEKQTFMLKNGEQSGSWKRISTNLSDAPVKHSVFTLYLEHGIKPKNGSYEYIVVPGITREETAAYSENMPVRILKNSHHIQAVEHVPLKTAGVVFHKPGQISLTSGLTVSADHQCFVLISENPDGSFGVSAANPETPGLKLTITLKNAGNQKSVVYRFEEGIAFLGRSITKRVVLSQLEADN